MKDFAGTQQAQKLIKCVVWDLDNTLWDGILLEDDAVSLRDHVINVIKLLDGRGILHSIASKNEHHKAMVRLQEFGVSEYFLYPQINWGVKSNSIQKISQELNIGLDAIAFIDDQPFEREEVCFSLPQVLCLDITDLDQLSTMPETNPPFITEVSKKRRFMYLSESQRKSAEESFCGPREEFLEQLQMTFTISMAKEGDLERAEELTVRTNQLNTTGRTYSYDELNLFRQSKKHRLLIADLDDKFGGYGKIGLALIECQEKVWTIKLLLMSCRVMSRGVGTILINQIMHSAKKQNVRLCAEFVSNERNRMMYIAYKMAGFRECEQNGQSMLLENDLSHIQACPKYVTLQVID